jgi:hypothetical protein
MRLQLVHPSIRSIMVCRRSRFSAAAAGGDTPHRQIAGIIGCHLDDTGQNMLGVVDEEVRTLLRLDLAHSVDEGVEPVKLTRINEMARQALLDCRQSSVEIGIDPQGGHGVRRTIRAGNNQQQVIGKVLKRSGQSRQRMRPPQAQPLAGN